MKTFKRFNEARHDPRRSLPEFSSSKEAKEWIEQNLPVRKLSRPIGDALNRRATIYLGDDYVIRGV